MAVVVALAGALASPGGRAWAQAGASALLDVPYLSQSPELCGGAAVAMVLRYWGDARILPQDFAPLVHADDGGIPTGVLTAAVRSRGWQAIMVAAGADTARERIRLEIDRGRPLVALIQVGASTYHYVVIVGVTDRDVVVHDPARAPFRVMPWAMFDRAWAATGRWLMLVLPAGDDRQADGRIARPAAAVAEAAVAPGSPCTALVQQAVSLAIDGGDRDAAERDLVAATRLCPNDPAAWRELAGVRFSQSRWADARTLASTAVRLQPDDAYAWQLLATSRYLLDDLPGALAAWNHADEPRVDTIDIRGSTRTPRPVFAQAAGLRPRQLLTPDAFARALRRMREVPVASQVSMRYEPIASGFARVGVVVDERPLVPRGWPALALLGWRAAVMDELHVDLGGMLGAGDVESAEWRWAAGRPRVAGRLALPARPWLPGVVAIDAQWERQSYDIGPAGSPARVQETRRRIGLQMADWATSRLRWQVGAALDRLPDDGTTGTPTVDRPHVAIESTLDLRFAADRIALVTSGGSWTPIGDGGRPFGTANVTAAWRSTRETARPLWSALAEIGAASGASPLALWPGAGTGQGRSGLLRAHPLLDGGVITGAVFGRRVVDGSLEYAHPLMRALANSVAVAGFVDTGRAWHRPGDVATSPLYVDVGAGVRVLAPGYAGAIRIDIAHGLRGGGTALSAGWSGAWPLR